MGEVIKFLQDNAAFCLILLAIILTIEIFFAIVGQLRKDSNRRSRNVSASDDFYTAIAENGKDAYVLVRKSDSIVEFVSGNVRHILGMEPETIYNDLWAFTRTMGKKSTRKLKETIAQWDREETITMEFPFKNLNTDKKYWGRIHITVTENNQFYLMTLEDITEERTRMEQLQEEIEEVYRIDESKTTFLSKMSHEIRTPMNGMLGMISLAKMNIENTEESMDYLNKAENLSQFLLSIINDVLDMSRIESGKVELAYERLDIFAMAEKLRAMFQTTVEDKGIKFEMSIQDFTVRYLMGDELRMVQVITNFLSNSSKFTPAGGVISVHFRQMHIIDNKANIMISVKDTGKGMDPHFLSRIFNPFEQESATTAKNYGGSGLGMAIADNLIHLMGGEITVDSELGKGSQFTVFLALPIAEGDQTLPEEGQKLVAEEDLNAFSIEGYRILMAEDNEINALVAGKLLRARGAEVEVAVNGRKAVDMFDAHEAGYYDVILMDIQMPEMNGWEAAKAIRRLDRLDAASIPILALSADAFVEDKRKSREVGMNGHIAKPINYEELVKAIIDNQ